MPVGVSTIQEYLTLMLSCVRLFRDVCHIYLWNSCCGYFVWRCVSMVNDRSDRYICFMQLQQCC